MPSYTWKLASILWTIGCLGAMASAERAVGGSPYPPSLFIAGIIWDRETLRTAAAGSDLWPVTWGPDGHIDTSWGDGGGFGGTNSDGRVSMGFARIEGPPETFVAVNINGGKNAQHPASFPKKGKTGGLVSVSGTFYAWLNRQDGKWPDVNQALIWSGDLGASWRQASWYWPKGKGNFKPSTFLQFGRDYAGTRDEYVYFYGGNQTGWAEGSHAYLGRVHRTKLKTKDAYWFFAGLDTCGRPRWSRDVNQRKPVLTDPAGVAGVQVIYNAALKRYLLTAHRGDQGTLGIFDAPEPWGPWTTVAYDDNWLDLKGPGIGREMLYINIPTKWIADNGRTLWAIFTGGQDRFMLIKGTLTLRKMADRNVLTVPRNTVIPATGTTSALLQLVTRPVFLRHAGASALICPTRSQAESLRHDFFTVSERTTTMIDEVGPACDEAARGRSKLKGQTK